MTRTLILGGPGTGKTTRLLNIMEESLEKGILPERIAFVTFTNAAANEARDRACKRFGLAPKELPNFRTLHSLAFRELSLQRHDVVGEEHLSELSEITGELFSGDQSTEGPAAGRNADPLLTLDHYARTTRQSIHAAWSDHGGSVEWFRLKRFSDAYAAYKAEHELLDFTDMLESYVNSALPPIGLDVAIVDEVQDLSLLQHAVVEKAFSTTPTLYAAGDDDQSIHRWAGAAEDYLYTLPYAREVLPLSFRLPSAIFDFSQRVVDRIARRFPKEHGAKNSGGLVEWVSREDEVDLSSGQWLLLARTRAQLNPLVALAREQGALYSVKGRSSVSAEHVRAIVAYEALRAGRRVEGVEVIHALRSAGVVRDIAENMTYTAAELKLDCAPIWHDALVRIPLDDREYYLAALRRGEDLKSSPRIRIETIHGAKGLEAANVLLVTDLTYRTHRGYELDPDSEHRVLYVGLTRASERLVLLAPQSAYGYPM